MLGLLDYYDITGDESILAAVRRVANHLLSEVGPGKVNITEIGWFEGLMASSILEPMMLLYNRSGDERYLEFAQYIVGQWPKPKNPQIYGIPPVYGWEPRSNDHPHAPDLINGTLNGVPPWNLIPANKNSLPNKAYEMMSCFEGVLELYRVTGDERLFEASKQFQHNLIDEEITIVGSGSAQEKWFGGRYFQIDKQVEKWMETCVTTTWIKFNTQLLRLTGDSKIADQIELSLYNALLGSMSSDGSWWTYFSPMEGSRGKSSSQCGMELSCCVANGPRALLLMPQIAVMSDDEGLVVNLYEEGKTEAALPSGENVKLVMQTDFPLSGEVKITVQCDEPCEFPLSMRIPEWSENTQLSVNTRNYSKVNPGSYRRISRTWKNGDTIHLSLDMTPHVVHLPGFRPHIAIKRGPVVLAMDKRLMPKNLKGNVRPDFDAQYKLAELTPVQDGGGAFNTVFDVPFKNMETDETVYLRMCDFASAGNTWALDSQYQTWFPVIMDLSNPFALSAEKAKEVRIPQSWWRNQIPDSEKLIK
jgi:hypothetical protein